MSDKISQPKKQVIWTYYPVTVLTAIFCCVLWGSAAPAIKIAYNLFQIGPDDTGSRILLAGARFTLAGLMTIAFAMIRSRSLVLPKRSSLKYIAILGLVQTVGQYYFFFMALANASSVRCTIINAANNFFTILLAALVFRLEKMTIRKIAGCAVGFAGILLILGGISSFLQDGGFSFAGEGAVLLAAMFYALSGCLIKIYSAYEDPVVLSGYQFVFGGLILILIGAVMGGRLHFTSSACIFNLLYMGFVSAGAYTFWGILLKYNPVSRVSILGFVNPVMGVLLSALLLGENQEAFSLNGLAALALVSLGIMIVNSGKKHEAVS